MEERIGHYSIVAELGRGGMGVVYKAHEESLNRFVALKVLGKHLSEDESFVERFKREAQSAAALNHPNIVQVYSIDEFDGQHCFAMEYVQGVSIQQMIKAQGPMDPVTAGRLILQAASGLAAAHGEGIVHRDIKPANLMVDERGLVKIADFGLALLAAGTTRLTATGMFMGTPGYLSPEQCLDEDIDQRTDIYSLGVTLYEMLTGVIPLNADSPLALLRQIIDVEPKDVGELRPEVPERLRAILRKMMAKKPADRYANCSALTTDLQSWLETTGESNSDLSAAIAASVSTGATATNTDSTVLMDSAQNEGGIAAKPGRDNPRRMSATLLTAIIVILMAGVGFAAWQFGVTEDPQLVVTEENGEGEGTVGTDFSGRIEKPAESTPPAMEVAEIQSNTQTRDETRIPKIAEENAADPVLDFDHPVAVGIETDAHTEADQPLFDEPQRNTSTGPIAAYSPPPSEPPVGTGVALVSIGEPILADSAADYVRRTLERHGIAVFDGMAIPGVADMLENGGGALQQLVRPQARYLVFIRADFTGERELYYMGRYDTELQARLNLETHDLLDGRVIGPAVHASIAYTQLSVEDKVADLLRPKFGRTAGNLTE